MSDLSKPLLAYQDAIGAKAVLKADLTVWQKT